jgi:hypothetical protein
MLRVVYLSKSRLGPNVAILEAQGQFVIVTYTIEDCLSEEPEDLVIEINGVIRLTKEDNTEREVGILRAIYIDV